MQLNLYVSCNISNYFFWVLVHYLFLKVILLVPKPLINLYSYLYFQFKFSFFKVCFFCLSFKIIKHESNKRAESFDKHFGLFCLVFNALTEVLKLEKYIKSSKCHKLPLDLSRTI